MTQTLVGEASVWNPSGYGEYQIMKKKKKIVNNYN